MQKPKITVIGSVNMDLVTTTSVRPKVGETVLGQSFSNVPGGKGANQAVAAARLGSNVNLIGCVGNDAFGHELRTHLKKEKVTLLEVKRNTTKQTGIAQITLSDNDNSIIVVPGANEDLTPSVLDHFENVIAESDILLLQLEIPIETVEYAISLAATHGVPVILNPAPIQLLSAQMLEKVAYVTPNEHEADVLSSMEGVDLTDNLIVTKGKHGVSFWENTQEINIKSHAVDVVDTTGAGDAFNGALAVAISEGKSVRDACLFATAVGALAVTRLGAQSGMPTSDEVEEFLSKLEKKS
ncbi:ribokinase [Halalkalibacter kiskunsagensis]|uniref:Ribokinase n=1 Tax=Halalkalibacter kiskunsagensis TaxID=1548599 RepID=A0ABV6KI36_9BACI